MAEFATRGEPIAPGLIRSLYLGGGTPSKLGGDGVENLVSRLIDRLNVDNSRGLTPTPEITIEANPEDVDLASARRWVETGVNRVSLGVQSFDESVLAWMHREHGAEAPGQAVRNLREVGIEDVSIDLIFALPEVLRRDWDRDLDLALALSPTHISLYGLTVEPRTPLGRWAERGTVSPALEDRYEVEYLRAHDRLRASGFDHYEVSNFSQPGRRAVHNSAYWSGAAYLGLGPGAHGFDGRRRRWNPDAYVEWLRRVEAGSDPVEGSEELTAENRVAEEVYLGLRTDRGLTVRQNELKTVTSWIEQGWGSLQDSVLRLTALGWLRLDSLATTLTALRSRS